MNLAIWVIVKAQPKYIKTAAYGIWWSVAAATDVYSDIYLTLNLEKKGGSNGPVLRASRDAPFIQKL